GLPVRPRAVLAEEGAAHGLAVPPDGAEATLLREVGTAEGQGAAEARLASGAEESRLLARGPQPTRGDADLAGDVRAYAPLALGHRRIDVGEEGPDEVVGEAR